MISTFSHFEGNVYFADEGNVVFRVTANTKPIRVSGSVHFGGSITVDVSLLPKSVSNMTLMTFDSSTAYFTIFTNQYSQLHYYKDSLVVDFDNWPAEETNHVWVIVGTLVGVGLFIIILVAVIMITKRKNLNATVDLTYSRYE